MCRAIALPSQVGVCLSVTSTNYSTGQLYGFPTTFHTRLPKMEKAISPFSHYAAVGFGAHNHNQGHVDSLGTFKYLRTST
jgi:hypothetical protein